MDGQWFADYGNVTQLGHWLMESRFTCMTELQRYYEKPYNWTDEWNEMQADIRWEKSPASPE
jgi:hypothetical protein